MKILALLVVLALTNGQQLRGGTTNRNGVGSTDNDQQILQVTEEFVQAVEGLDVKELAQYIDEYSQINFAGLVYEGRNSLAEFGRLFTQAAKVDKQKHEIIATDEATGNAIINSTMSGTFVSSKKPFRLNKLMIIKWTPKEKIDTWEIVLINPNETLTAYMTNATLCMEQSLGPRLKSDNPLNLTEGNPIRDFMQGENISFTVIFANDTNVVLKLLDGSYPIQLEHHVYGQNCSLKSIEATFIPIMNPNFYPIYRKMLNGNETSGNTTETGNEMAGNTTETGNEDAGNTTETGNEDAGNTTETGEGATSLLADYHGASISPTALFCQQCMKQYPGCSLPNANCPPMCKACKK